MATPRKRRRNRRNRSSAKNLQSAVSMLIELRIPLPRIAKSLKLPLEDVQRIEDNTPILDKLKHHEHLGNTALMYELYARLTVDSWSDQLSMTQHLLHQVLYDYLDIRITRQHLVLHLEKMERDYGTAPVDHELLYEKAKECLQVCYIRIATRAIGAPQTHADFQFLAEQQLNWLMRLERNKQKRKPQQAPA